MLFTSVKTGSYLLILKVWHAIPKSIKHAQRSRGFWEDLMEKHEN